MIPVVRYFLGLFSEINRKYTHETGSNNSYVNPVEMFHGYVGTRKYCNRILVFEPYNYISLCIKSIIR